MIDRAGSIHSKLVEKINMFSKFKNPKELSYLGSKKTILRNFKNKVPIKQQTERKIKNQ